MTNHIEQNLVIVVPIIYVADPALLQSYRLDYCRGMEEGDDTLLQRGREVLDQIVAGFKQERDDLLQHYNVDYLGVKFDLQLALLANSEKDLLDDACQRFQESKLVLDYRYSRHPRIMSSPIIRV